MNELIKKFQLEIKSLFWGEPQSMLTEEKMEGVVYFAALAAYELGNAEGQSDVRSEDFEEEIKNVYKGRLRAKIMSLKMRPDNCEMPKVEMDRYNSALKAVVKIMDNEQGE